MKTFDEPLLPERGRLPKPVFPKLHGFWLGSGLIVAALVTGYLPKSDLASPVLAATDRGVIASNWIPRVLLETARVVLAMVVPYFVAIATFWIAFIRPNVRDRYLSGAVTIVSSGQLAAMLDMAWFVPLHRFISRRVEEFITFRRSLARSRIVRCFSRCGTDTLCDCWPGFPSRLSRRSTRFRVLSDTCREPPHFAPYC
ncbi:MAG TPA: hypothetical protein VMD47_04585 [Candidatus Acidoferrales bacterium]|nr:hypothetical protein [Candidatus Acidoferrales bacterium]